MKKFEVYRNIRKRAMIFGLPISLFALQILSIIGSLMVMIFSFSMVMILGAIVLNTILYLVLTRMTNSSLSINYGVFPTLISNKKSTGFTYEKD